MSESRRVVLILGASGGIGSSLARRLSAGGVRLLLAARDPASLGRLADETRSLAVPLDATSPAEVEAAAAGAIETRGRLDGVVDCVGSLLLKPGAIAWLLDPAQSWITGQVRG